MASGGIDAFITFGNGIYPGGKPFTIDGEAEDIFEKDYKSSQIKSYTFDFSLSLDAGTETGNQEADTMTHTPHLEAVTITKQLDLASPKILHALCHAAVFDWVAIWQKRAGGAKGRSGDYFWKIELDEVNISNLTWNAEDDGMPTETLKLEYHGISVDYIPQKHTGELDKGRHKEAKYHDQHDRRVSKTDASNVDVDKVVQAVIEKLKKMKKIPA